MKAIHALSQRYGFKVIEDASHAIGGKYLGEPIGNSRYSDVTVFSFHPVKIITTGEGGMALTNNHALAKRIERLRSHGITRNLDEMTQASDEPWYYQQVELGFNYRMTDIQAALGLSQLKRLDEFIGKRHAIAKYYDESFSDLAIIKPWQHKDSHSAFHLYVIRLKLEQINKSRREVFDTLRACGIGVNVHYIPVYQQPYYSNMGFSKEFYPGAEQYYLEAISLPIYPTLVKAQQDHVIDSLHRALEI
jgi:dTDP-4-amino-4,6-dideoxygalactose transaminase